MDASSAASAAVLDGMRSVSYIRQLHTSTTISLTYYKQRMPRFRLGQPDVPFQAG